MRDHRHPTVILCQRMNEFSPFLLAVVWESLHLLDRLIQCRCHMLIYPAHFTTRKSTGLMTRKLSVTESR